MQDEVKNEELSKQEKQFEEALGLFSMILGGKQVFAPLKLLPDHLQAAVAELAAEEISEIKQKFKDGARSLIKKKAEHDEHMKQLEKDFQKKKEESMKVFTEEASRLKRLISNVQEIEKKYYNTLKSADTGTSSTEA